MRIASIKQKSEPFDGDSKHISDTALGLDDAGCAWVALELAPEAENLHVDATIEHILVNAGCLQKVFSAERALRGFEERNQHRILALGQRYCGAGRIGKLADPAVELPTRKSKVATLRVAYRRGFSDIKSSQNGANAREQFAQVKWLCQVIVGPELQSDHAIDIVAAVTCDDDDRHVGAKADLSQQIQAILQPEPEIENHEIDSGAVEPVDHLLAI